MNDSLEQDEARQARTALDEANTRRIGSMRDRRIHGIATALIGIILGAALAIQPESEGPTLFLLVVIVCFIAVGAWQTRAARSTPRSTNRTAFVGIGATVVMVIAFVVLRQTLEVRGDELTWPLRIGSSLLVAAPMIVAGLVIGRGGQR